MKFASLWDHTRHGVELQGLISDIEIMGAPSDPARLLIEIRQQVAKSVAEAVMAKLGPAIDTALVEAFRPKEPPSD